MLIRMSIANLILGKLRFQASRCTWSTGMERSLQPRKQIEMDNVFSKILHPAITRLLKNNLSNFSTGDKLLDRVVAMQVR